MLWAQGTIPLGYPVFDPSVVVPEFTADMGAKKGEKVDDAIMVDGRPAILIEAKIYGDDLTTHNTQLFRYFSATEAKTIERIDDLYAMEEELLRVARRLVAGTSEGEPADSGD